MSNPYEDRARDEKARKLARRLLAETIKVADALDVSEWRELADRAEVLAPSAETRERVVEILEGIAI